ncbi:MAG: 30S ribosomal protein S4 [bacterium]|nr:30S ribosomal protein S4 [bacterium]
MLQIKSKYKIAKRLGAGIFEQTQTQKFALSEARSKATKTPRGRRGGSDYGRQLLEKQRLRFTYGLSERQLSNYAEEAFSQPNPPAALHKALEMRADNAAYRAGIATTRRAARQIVSHGHITVNGKRITIPSYKVHKGDVIAVREGSRTSSLFTRLTDPEEASKGTKSAWIVLDAPLMKAEVVEEPTYTPAESGIDYSTVFEFYSR